MIYYYFGDISKAKADIIVNASNGIGFCGGKASVNKLQSGIAESLNFATKGDFEKECKKTIRTNKGKIKGRILGYGKGEYFITDNCGLSCKKIFNAVTMRYPASKSNVATASTLLVKIFAYLSNNNYRTVALPLLCCGTGGANTNRVHELILNISKKYKDITVYLCTKSEKDLKNTINKDELCEHIISEKDMFISNF